MPCHARSGVARVQNDATQRNAHFACRSHSAESRMSASLIVPFELEYMNRLHCWGWNSAAVMTSVSSSMLTGLMSTMSARRRQGRVIAAGNAGDSLKLWSLMFKFQRLILRSSAEM